MQPIKDHGEKKSLKAYLLLKQSQTLEMTVPAGARTYRDGRSSHQDSTSLADSIPTPVKASRAGKQK